jgi:hypothetical protein
MNRTRTLLAGSLLVATLTSCATPAKQSNDKDAKGKEIEYVYITPTGSNVPIRVPKDQVNSGGDDSATSNKGFEDLQRNGTTGMATSPGGK